MTAKQDHHYFISTFTDWVTGERLLDAIMKLPREKIARKAGYVAIYRVPLPHDAKYSISNYAPEVCGAELIYLDNGGDHTDDEWQYEAYTACGTREQLGGLSREWIVKDNS